MRKTVCVLIAVVALGSIALIAPAADACVGKTIYLGRLPGVEQEVLTEIFVWLVSERTGTSVVVKPFQDSSATHSALEKAEIDLYLEDPFTALTTILGHDGSPPVEMRDLVRREYRQRFNLVWLEPWGLEGKTAAGAMVAPVIRRDTIKKFPALSRLVNKLAGVVDGRTMERLVADSGSAPVRDVTKKFLKENKLI